MKLQLLSCMGAVTIATAVICRAEQPATPPKPGQRPTDKVQRCHSASSEASASSRVTATAMALGEAAGCAAALAVQAKSEVAALDGVKVRESLAQQSAGPFTDA